MKRDWNHLERYRVLKGPMATQKGDRFGAFRIGALAIIADDAGPLSEGWEHVSVSGRHAAPSWYDMQAVKSLFWEDEETVVQFHPAKSEHINCHPHCLHLWRNKSDPPKLPPSILVGPGPSRSAGPGGRSSGSTVLHVLPKTD